MMPNINPRQMQQAMKRLGIQQQDVDATEVIIRTPEKDIVIINPSVQKVNMMGQISFQISGNVEERSVDTAPDISDDDIATVAEQTNVSKEVALEAIKNHNGDLAAAILDLQK